MTSPVLEFSSTNPLLSLLQEHFSVDNLTVLVGREGAGLQRHWDEALRGPLGRFLAVPGKELRAQLMGTFYLLAGGEGQCPSIPTLIIEALHAGSLIVDDIEDSSPQRRGQPSLHVQCGVPIALNAGNWMYFWALSLVDSLELPAEARSQLHARLNRTLLCCHHGQALDITVKISELPQPDVAPLVRTSTGLKTGSLMELAAAMAALPAGASGRRLEAIAKFGGKLGVGLQMLDDLGGIVSEKRKSRGEEDLMLGRPTWPWAWLAEDLGQRSYARLLDLSKAVVADEFPASLLARMMRQELRGSGRVRVRRHLSGALAELSSVLGPSAALQRLKADIQRLEKSYG